jgi:putative FmdB family regulatory protein
MGNVPIYEFECEECGVRFEELVAAGATSVACAECGSARTRRLMSSVSPPGRQPRGAAVRSNESQRREREAGRQDRIAESRQKRARGENPHPPKKKKGTK